MRQFLESVIFFQFATCRYSPIARYFKDKIDITDKERYQKFGLLSVLFLSLFFGQVMMYTQGKQSNFYELLQLESWSVTQDQIQTAFKLRQEHLNPKNNPDADLKLFQQIKEAFDCLKQTDCRNEYTRYGSQLQLEQVSQDFKFDWRLSFTVCFYIVFALVQGSIASNEQKPALRLGMGLGIMFCMSEIQLLQDVLSFIQDGQPQSRQITALLSPFPGSYCAFEVVTLMRISFIMFFNLINIGGICLQTEEGTLKVLQGNKIYSQQIQITQLLQNLYNKQSHIDKDPNLILDVNQQWSNQDIQLCGQKNLQDLEQKIKAIKGEPVALGPSKWDKGKQYGTNFVWLVLFIAVIYNRFYKLQE